MFSEDTDLTLNFLFASEYNAMLTPVTREKQKENARIEDCLFDRKVKFKIIHYDICVSTQTTDDMETYQWLFNKFHPTALKIDPYQQLWISGIHCDKCGETLNAINKSLRCSTLCEHCEKEEQERHEYFYKI